MATPVPTTPALVSLEAFHGIIWGGFGLCIIAYTGRITIRVVCFRRLFAEDYLMTAALLILLAATTLGQLFLKYIYALEDVSNGAVPSPDFLQETSIGLRSFAALTVLNYIGIWLVKLNFLLFFRRLGNHVTQYRVLWWFVLFVNLAAGITCIGLIDFKCVVPPAEIVFATCNGIDAVTKSYTAAKVSASLDAVSDGLIVAFPFWILWGSKLNMQKKLTLSGIFGLVAFTIAVSIIRGSIFGGVYQSISENHLKQLNITWIWFWFNIEYIVAFTVGCLISFRTLYGQRHENSQEALEDRRRQARLRQRSNPTTFRARARMLREEITTTLMTWEDITRADEDSYSLPRPPTGKLSVDLERGEGWNRHSSVHELPIVDDNSTDVERQTSAGSSR
ncbi:hypothetical protein F4680DRAFT_124993 [Xylaria scruposa]|nr:hypothetical protein F4680DRAFT_124993 [Xylaria scruposa]